MIYEQEIPAYATTSGDHGALNTVWKYDSDDPAAVTIVFQIEVPVTWLISRDLFVKGLSRPVSVGEGDIRVQSDGVWLRMFLDPPQGTACVRVIRSDVQEFIDETFEIVASEIENQTVAEKLDGALAMILSEGV
jgi:hypothetical protein